MVAGLLPLPLTLSLPHHLRFVFNIVAVLSDVTLVFLTICSASLTVLQCFQISLFLTIRNASLTLARFSDVTLSSYLRCIFNIVAILSGLQPSRHQRCHRTNLAPGNMCQDTGSWCSLLSSQGSQFLPQPTGIRDMAMHSCCSEVCLVLVPRLTNRAKHSPVSVS